MALKYNDIIAMKRAERSALVKGMDVIYIYHDTIDEASHTSDTAVFAACDKAISELKNLVRIIVNEFGGTKYSNYGRSWISLYIQSFEGRGQSR